MLSHTDRARASKLVTTLKSDGYTCNRVDGGYWGGHFAVFNKAGDRITPSASTPQTARDAWSEAANYLD